MPRANRHHLPGYVWHLTHRCHRKQFLLKFARDRQHWIDWLYEARRRYGLCVLDYTVTRNHVHLLVRDRGCGEIALAMQLVAGRIAQAYNLRKGRRGAFWEDRYHATAVDSFGHLARCLVYIDLNMVRAGAVPHPAAWAHGGYHEIQTPPGRYRIIDRAALADALGLENDAQLATVHRRWIDDAIAAGHSRRAAEWTEALAVGRREFVAQVGTALGSRARYRHVESLADFYVLRESSARYPAHFGAKSALLKPP